MALSAFLRHGPTLATVPFNSLFSVDPSLPKIKLESENIDTLRLWVTLLLTDEAIA